MNEMTADVAEACKMIKDCINKFVKQLKTAIARAVRNIPEFKKAATIFLRTKSERIRRKQFNRLAHQIRTYLLNMTSKGEWT